MREPRIRPPQLPKPAESAFWSGLRAYTLAGLKGGVTSPDLERAMEAASGQDLKSLFDACVYGAGPVE